MSARAIRTLAAVLASAALAGCGSAEESGDVAAGARPELTVAAAASLREAFAEYGRAFDDAQVRFSFAGSDELAAQIEQGVTPDVYAAANTSLPDELHAAGLVEKPVVFAGNRLVLAVPADDAEVGSLGDLRADGVRLAIGTTDVPVGAYTRRVLDALPAHERQAILANVRTEEPNVSGIVGKLTQGAVDAGFLYVSDVRATDGALRAIELPEDLRPSVAYGAAVVAETEQPDVARAFIDGLLGGDGAQALSRAGFEPPPAP